MATTEITQLRGLTDGADGLTDVELQEYITAEGGVKQAAVFVWRTKAAQTASLVDTTESGSSRKQSDLHKQALTMAESIAKDIIVETTIDAAAPKRSRRAVRR